MIIINSSHALWIMLLHIFCTIRISNTITRFEGWVQLQILKCWRQKISNRYFLLLPATRFHKVKIESPRWKSSIKVYTSTIPRFIFQWQLASDMIKDVFTLEQKVKWFAGSHYYLMRISHATVFWRSLSIMPRGIIFPSNSICVMT